jgi:hypothetical protein
MKIELVVFIQTAITMAVKASSEPTDKSIPALAITNVSPRAIIARTLICRPMLARFDIVRKFGEVIAITITIDIKIIKRL